MTQQAISVQNLRICFGQRVILNNLTLDAPVGGPTVLVGRSGCGKSTLLRAINRLNECFPDCQTSGRVYVRLHDAVVNVYAEEMPLATLRRRVGMVFQTPNVLPVSIARNITLPLTATSSVHKSELAGRVEKALRTALLWEEVKDRLAHPAATLSGGQQQRLCLARALALEPEILLLDEPTASLDFKAAGQVEDLLLSLAERYTLLLVSHSLSQARRLARRLLVMCEGDRIESLAPGALCDQAILATTLEEIF